MFFILYMKKIHIGRIFVVFLKKVFYNHKNALLRCSEKAADRLKPYCSAKGEEIQ